MSSQTERNQEEVFEKLARQTQAKFASSPDGILKGLLEYRTEKNKQLQEVQECAQTVTKAINEKTGRIDTRVAFGQPVDVPGPNCIIRSNYRSARAKAMAILELIREIDEAIEIIKAKKPLPQDFDLKEYIRVSDANISTYHVVMDAVAPKPKAEK